MLSTTSKSENSDSEIQRIEIIVNIDEPEYIKRLLYDYFSRECSPTYPVYASFDLILGMGSGSMAKAIGNNCYIMEYDEKKDINVKLAKILINQYPSQVVVFIQVVEYDNVEAWKKIKEITREIIEKMAEKKYEIASVKPDELILKSRLQPWEQIQNRGANREILQLWHKGHTNSEISQMVGRDKRTITNIISRLRTQYGEEIVPKDEARRRLTGSKKL